MNPFAPILVGALLTTALLLLVLLTNMAQP